MDAEYMEIFARSWFGLDGICKCWFEQHPLRLVRLLLLLVPFDLDWKLSAISAQS